MQSDAKVILKQAEEYMQAAADFFPIFLVILVILAVICVILAVCDHIKKHGKLRYRLYVPVGRKGLIHDELARAFYKMAVLDFRDQGRSVRYQSFDVHVKELAERWESYIIVCRETSLRSVFEFNPDFCDWVEENAASNRVCDLHKVVMKYVRVLEQQEQQARSDKEDEEITVRISEAFDEIREKRNADKEPLKPVSRHDIVAAYNHQIDTISEEGHGLMPYCPKFLSAEAYRNLYICPLYSHQAISDFMTGNVAITHANGCYIAYNTFRDKYFIGQADDLARGVKQLWTGHENFDFYADLVAGHLMLVKIVRLAGSDYNTCDSLYSALVSAYSAAGSTGYNK